MKLGSIKDVDRFPRVLRYCIASHTAEVVLNTLYLA